MPRFINKNLIKRIEINQKKLGGKPIIKGTRVSIEQILRMLGAGRGIQDILKDYPQLEPYDIYAALEYASDLVKDFRLYPKEYLNRIKIRA